uniref:HEAT repeat domain-containing protein n=1 Tax=uncultured sulfate-reducing bacterium TaxID=153939 RepID=Q3IBS6_9BACT|nr:hypothetical protein 42c90012 [uncultured sulfate-reducing bacterium]
MELFRAGDGDGLEAIVLQRPQAVRHLIGRMWDTDQEVRRLAARALGVAAAADPEKGADLARRLLWALNDESATNGLYGLAALGEMGFSAPDLMAPFVGPMASYLWDEGLRLEILKALARMAESDRGLIESVRGVLEDHADTSDPEEMRLIEGLLNDTTGGPHES